MTDDGIKSTNRAPQFFGAYIIMIRTQDKNGLGCIERFTGPLHCNAMAFPGGNTGPRSLLRQFAGDLRNKFGDPKPGFSRDGVLWIIQRICFCRSDHVVWTDGPIEAQAAQWDVLLSSWDGLA